MRDMILFIHTFGRAYRQTTLDWVKHLRANVCLVVQARESTLYQRYIDDYEVLELPRGVEMLSPTRQAILEYAHNQKIQKFVLLDDDLRFFKRQEPTANTKANHSLLNATPEEVTEMFTLLEDWLNEVAHAGLSAREGNNRIPEDYTEVGRMMRCLAYRTDLVMKAKARFDRIDTKQDFDMTLQLIRAGYKNRISWVFAQGQATGSGAKGGCAGYRTKEMMDRCAQELADLHPGFVKVVEKESRGSFGGGVRTDVRIAWQKAYQEGLAKHKGVK